MDRSKIVFATHNVNKLIEIQASLGDAFELISLADLNYFDDIPETANTFEGNALIKARTIFSTFNLPCFADDSGLQVAALNGEPGIYSARYAGEPKDDQANYLKLLRNLHGKENRQANFKTVIAFVSSFGEFTFEGKINGEILHLPIGDNGFGYDPIFQPDGYNLSFAQMTLLEKKSISHRAIAFKKFIEFLKAPQKY
jgi:XTP/dITP diphosphohydrolase